MKRFSTTQSNNSLVLRHFGLNVKTERINQNLSLKDFCRFTGFSEDQVNKIEKGEIDVNISEASLIAKTLKLELVRLFDFDQSKM